MFELEERSWMSINLFVCSYFFTHTPFLIGTSPHTRLHSHLYSRTNAHSRKTKRMQNVRKYLSFSLKPVAGFGMFLAQQDHLHVLVHTAVAAVEQYISPHERVIQNGKACKLAAWHSACCDGSQSAAGRIRSQLQSLKNCSI